MIHTTMTQVVLAQLQFESKEIGLADLSKMRSSKEEDLSVGSLVIVSYSQ